MTESTSRRPLAVFLPSLRGGGAERSMLRLAHAIAERGYPVDLVLARAEGPYLAELEDSVRLVDLNAARVLQSLPGLTRYLRRERPQALLSALDYANIVALWARRLAGRPLRMAVNEQNTVSVDALHTDSWRGRMIPHLIKRFYPWATTVIGNSQGVADDLARLLAGSGDALQRLRVIYNPVVTDELSAKTRAPLDHPWLQPDQPPVVLAVGRLAEQKDYPTLIRAFAAARRPSSARLLILGEGPLRPELERLIAQLGLNDHVALPGFVDNPYAYMSRAALYALSSAWEGLPTVLIEALYCGLPIVATDCPSGPHEILDGGRYGRLVPVGDVDALAQALGAALAGDVARPPPQSWQPYRAATVTDQYIELLL